MRSASVIVESKPVIKTDSFSGIGIGFGVVVVSIASGVGNDGELKQEREEIWDLRKGFRLKI